MIIRGKNLRVFYNASCIAESRSCVISVKSNTEDSTTKDNTGLATSEAMVSRTWTMQVDTLDVGNLGTLLTVAKEGTEVVLSYDETAGAMNRVAQDEFLNTGTAIITQIRAQFNNNQLSNVSISFQGTGTLFYQEPGPEDPSENSENS